MNRGMVNLSYFWQRVSATPPEEQALQVRKALKVVGYDTHTVSRGGRTYILPGEARQTAREPEPKKHDDRER